MKFTKNQIGWLAVLMIAFSGVTYASASWVLWNLFRIPWTADSNGSVSTSYRLDGRNIEDGTVTDLEIMSGAINTDHLVDSSVTSIKIATGSIEHNHLAPWVGWKWRENGLNIYYNSWSV